MLIKTTLNMIRQYLFYSIVTIMSSKYILDTSFSNFVKCAMFTITIIWVLSGPLRMHLNITWKRFQLLFIAYIFIQNVIIYYENKYAYPFGSEYLYYLKYNSTVELDSYFSKAVTILFTPYILFCKILPYEVSKLVIVSHELIITHLIPNIEYVSEYIESLVDDIFIIVYSASKKWINY